MKGSSIQKCLLLVATLLTLSSHAIITRHDNGVSQYVVNASLYPAVFYLEKQGNRKVCVATLIHESWAITAAHCTQETSLAQNMRDGKRFEVTMAGRVQLVDRLVVHPEYGEDFVDDVDLALLHFSEPLSFPRPIPLHSSKDELEKTVSILGWGFYGLGTTGREYDDGKLRLAQNQITKATNKLQFEFEDPRLSDSRALDLEGVPGLGDSGGPALIETDTGHFLAGVAVGELVTPGFSEETQGKYGAIAVYERISSHLDWIRGIVGTD
jgi:secreted trypsin-like serine protease